MQQFETAAWAAIRKQEHGRHELYLAGDLFISPRFVDPDYQDTSQFPEYRPKRSPVPGTYFYCPWDDLLARLDAYG